MTTVVPCGAQKDDLLDLDVQPQATHRVKPVYPFEMKRLGITGQILIGFVVDPKGNVTAAYTLKSSHPGFRQAAIDAVLKWRFKPGLKDGRPVNALMQVPILFGIRGKPNNPGWWVERPHEFSETIPPEFRWDVAPKLVEYNPPVYPRQALLERRHGKVTVDFVVGTDGQVVNTQAEPGGDADMQAAAVAAVQTFRFKPARFEDGRVSGAILKMTFDFYFSSRTSDAPYTKEMKRIVKVLQKSPDTLPGLKDLDHMPRAVAQRAPTVPPRLAKGTEPAEALVEFVISRNGLVLLPQVIETSDPEFGYAALQAVADWGFMPPEIDGQRVDVIARVPVSYQPTPTEE